MNIAVSCGGVAVNPGDAILADDNGIAVIPVDTLDETIETGNKWMAGEQAFIKHLLEHPDLCYPDETGASRIIEEAMKQS